MSSAALKDALPQQENRALLFESEEISNKIAKIGVIMTGNVCIGTKIKI